MSAKCKKILNDDRIISNRESLRHVFGDCEIALEKHWADRIEASTTVLEGKCNHVADLKFF